jgi:hypothetical protein
MNCIKRPRTDRVAIRVVIGTCGLPAAEALRPILSAAFVGELELAAHGVASDHSKALYKAIAAR